MKLYKRRSSATAILRKMGIMPKHYSRFIVPTPEGTFLLDIELAKQESPQCAKGEAHEAPKPKEAASTHTPSPPKTKEVAKKKKSPPKKVESGGLAGETRRQVAGDMIKQGASNKEVWDAIQPRFNLKKDRMCYVSWLRCHMRRKGEIPPETRERKRSTQVVYV